MKEALFWEALDLARSAGSRGHAASLFRILKEIPEQEIIAFARLQHRFIGRLYTPKILAAHFILCSYTSDDSFEDFTAWIVAQGKDAYTRIGKSPDHLAELIDKKDVDRINGETFLMLAGQAYEAKTGKDDFSDLAGFAPRPPIKIRWPESRKAYEAAYPVLYRKFWNQKRIEEMHPRRKPSP